jgi:hypothetical protein
MVVKHAKDLGLGKVKLKASFDQSLNLNADATLLTTRI